MGNKDIIIIIIHTYIHTYIRAYVHACVRACIRAYIHDINTYIHTNARHTMPPRNIRTNTRHTHDMHTSTRTHDINVHTYIRMNARQMHEHMTYTHNICGIYQDKDVKDCIIYLYLRSLQLFGNGVAGSISAT